MPSFEILDHTADLSLRAYGSDLRELLENAAHGLLALLYTDSLPEPEAIQELSVSAEEPEYLIQHALRELLYMLEDGNDAPVMVTVTQADKNRALLSVGTVPLERMRGHLGAEIKAVTRHSLEITNEPTGLSLTLVFDV